MPVYANQHGAVQTAYVGYKAYTLTANLQLFWPTSYYDAEDLVAAFMRVDQTGGPFTITLPDATQVSVGENFIISNIDNLAINLAAFGGGVITTIANGTAWYFILRDNSTPAGLWSFVQFGAGTSSATATSLNGYGLNPLALLQSNESRLNTQIAIKNIGSDTTNPLPYNVEIEDYTSMFVCTGGGGTIILPTVTTTPATDTEVPPFYYVSINNLSGGLLTLTPQAGDGIQGQASFSVAPGQTLTIVAVENQITIGGVATRWFTLGFGQQNTTGVTVLNKNVAGAAGTTILTAAEASNLIQQYTGVLTGARIMEFPATPGEWFVYNETTGNTLSVKVTGGGNTYAIPTGGRAIFYSDGPELYSIPNNIGTGTVTSVSTATTSGLTLSVDTPTTTPVVHVDLPGGGTANQLLRIVSTGPQVLGWVAPSAGSVTSVGVASTTGLAVTGSPVTGAGTINVEFGNSILLSDGAVPAAPVAGKAIVCVNIGIPVCRSAAGTIARTGAIVTANNDGGGSVAPTAGKVSLAAGTATINSTAVFATSIILITVQGAPTALGACEVTVSARVANTSFTITSSNNADTRDVQWMIINPTALA